MTDTEELREQVEDGAKRVWMEYLHGELGALLSDDNLTDEKLREASEGLLPRLYDALTRRLRARQREEGGRCSTCGFPVGHAFGCGEDGPDDDDTSLPLDTFVEGLGTVRECRGCRALLAGGPTRCVRCAKEGDPGATPQREGEREPVRVVGMVAYNPGGIGDGEYLQAVTVNGRLYEWRGGNVGWVELSDGTLYTEPPAEPDLDELTPRCPACRETMHDCECNPYMDTEGDDG